MDFRGPGQLNISPVGLLTFFRAKTGGRNPQGLSETLQGTFDLKEHYLNTNAEYSPRAAQAYSTVVGAELELFGLAEYWRFFLGVTVEWIPLNALDAYSAQLLTENPTTGQKEVPYPIVGSGVAGLPGFIAFPADAALIPRFTGWSGFWVAPGRRVILQTYSGVNTGGLATVASSARFVRFQP